MTVLLISDYAKDPKEWGNQLRRRGAELDLRGWDEQGDPRAIEVVLIDTFMGERGGFAQFPALRWVHYIGHGVGDILQDPSLPPGIPVTRMRRRSSAQGLAIYVVHAVTAHHLRAERYREQQRNRIWRRLEVSPVSSVTVVVLGLGIIGETIARRLRELGYAVHGWSRTEKTLSDILCAAGSAALLELLPRCDVVVGALPETPGTIGLIDRETIARMKEGAFIVNVGRGSLIVEPDLLEGLDTGRLSGAALDVFATEPLPGDHAFWAHPKIVLSPHAGGPGTDDMDLVFDEIAENYRRFRAGRPLLNLADRALGY